MSLLTSKEVLTMLKLKDQNVIGWLVQRGLLPRTAIGPRSFRYEASDVENLIERSRTEGLSLRDKPIKKAA